MNFWTLCAWSFQALLLPPLLICFTIAGVGLALAYFKQQPLRNPLWKHSYWLVFTQLLFFPAVIALGVLYPASGPSTFHGASTASCVYDIMGFSTMLLGTFWVYRMKGFRWFALSLVAVLEIILLGAFFIAGMAVSGDWL